MIGLRPKANALYLERGRLLEQLPDAGGYVVWLQAPYGYGKSVLTSQWASKLEADGWRVVWLSVQGEDPRGLSARALELPEQTLWSSVLEVLWSVPTLLILEDLEGSENISPLLRNVSGLILLASRGKLSQPELPRLMSAGQLIHLFAPDLAFTLSESKQLFDNDTRAQSAWEQSRGWSLPLHLMALTGSSLSGELPERESLIEGLRESLNLEQWQELALLAALPYLPKAFANSKTFELAKLGFVQILEPGYKLHPLAAESMLEYHLETVRESVLNAQERLSKELLAEGYGTTRQLSELEAVLEDKDLMLEPMRFQRLDALLPSTRSPGRWINLAHSFQNQADYGRTYAAYDAAIAHPDATPNQRLAACAFALMLIGNLETQARGERLLTVAEEMIPLADPLQVSSYYLNATNYFVNALAWDRAEEYLQNALALIPLEHEWRDFAERLARGHRATIAWERAGDVQSSIQNHQQNLLNPNLGASRVAFNHNALAFWMMLTGNFEAALEHCLKTESYHQVRPELALEARAERAYLEHDPQPFAHITSVLSDTTNWNGEWTLVLWSRTLRENGNPSAALKMLEHKHSPVIDCERALVLHALGKTKKALASIPTEPDSGLKRFDQLYRIAARYQIKPEARDLEQLLDLTLERERILPLLMPLEKLPRQHPELSLPYNLIEVLQSGWREAIQTRHHEIPPLELSVLGELRVRVLGEEVTLSQRPREILLLLLLETPREAIADMLWENLSLESVRNNFNVNLNALRKSLEPWGLSTYIGEHHLTCTESDWARLQAAINAQNAQAIQLLYTGKLAPTVDIPAIAEAREQLHDTVIASLERAAENAAPEQAVIYLERILELEPLMESAMNLLLENLVKLGRKQSAAKRLKAFLKRHKSEMGFEAKLELESVLT
jgi:DNA-binding SARP family transcriptional activator